MKVSVIIPTLNEEHYIEHILDDLRKQTYNPHEVIVVDGGSEDRTPEILKKRKDIIFRAGPRHQGIQRNIGAKLAIGEMLLFVDADTRLLPNFIEESLAQIQQKKLDIGIPQYLLYQSVKNLYLRGFVRCINGYVRLAQNINPYGAACGMFISKKVFDQTTGFEEVYKIDEVKLVRKACHLGKLGVLNTKVFLSDRRAKKYGVYKSSFEYAILGILLLFNQYKLADKIDYSFGEYHKS